MHWCSFILEINLPSFFLDEYSSCDGGTIMSWFAIACATRGNNKQGIGNQIATYKAKKSAIIWFHRVLRNFTPCFFGADLVLIEKRYEKLTSSPHPKHSFTVPMLRAARHYFPIDTLRGKVGYNCFVLSYFYLCRGGEMWLYPKSRQPIYDGMAVDWTSMQLDELADKSDHRIRYHEVHIYDITGIELFAPNFDHADSVAIKFLHSKADQIGRNDIIPHNRSGCNVICPVISAVQIKLARWELARSHGTLLGGPLSIDHKASEINTVIKSVAKSFKKNPNDYALHSVRVGAATAMFNAGYDALVIKLAGRWSSWCVELYTRIGNDTLKNASRDIISSPQ